MANINNSDARTWGRLEVAQELRHELDRLAKGWKLIEAIKRIRSKGADAELSQEELLVVELSRLIEKKIATLLNENTDKTPFKGMIPDMTAMVDISRHAKRGWEVAVVGQSHDDEQVGPAKLEELKAEHGEGNVMMRQYPGISPSGERVGLTCLFVKKTGQ